MLQEFHKHHARISVESSEPLGTSLGRGGQQFSAKTVPANNVLRTQ